MWTAMLVEHQHEPREGVVVALTLPVRSVSFAHQGPATCHPQPQLFERRLLRVLFTPYSALLLLQPLAMIQRRSHS